MPYREIALPKALLFLEPGPLTLITTFDGQKNNVMTISWIMPIDFDGGAVMATGPWNYSFEALRKSKECVVCIPAQDMLETAVKIGDVSGAKCDKFAHFHLRALPAKTVKAPLIAGCQACLECKVERIIKEYGFVVLRVKRIVADKSKATGRLWHARGDGTFTLDGGRRNLRRLMKDKLPPGL